jgi:hypothetical protein
MTTSNITPLVSRRTALAGLGASGLGIALATTVRQASAQDSVSMADHPWVGAWVINRDPSDTTESPTLNVVTADGGIIDPVMGVCGVWEATGLTTWNFTIMGITVETLAGGGAGSYAIIRGSGEVDASGDAAMGTASVTVVAADGTVLFSAQGPNTATRIKVEPMDAIGTPFAGFPEWTAAPTEEATPAS